MSDVIVRVGGIESANVGVEDVGAENIGVDDQGTIKGKDGVSPVVDTTPIEGGHKVTITDALGPHEFDVMDGEQGPTGPPGTTNYNGLENKPKLNDVTIEGEHDGEHYGFGNVSYLEYEEVASGGQQGQDDNPFSGGETVEYGSDAPASGDYADLQNKPRINGVILTGNVTTADLGIDYSQISGKPTINQAPLQSGDNSLASLGINRASNSDVNRLFL